MTETFYATQQVRALTGQGWPPAGIECFVVRGRPRLRSVHRERACIRRKAFHREERRIGASRRTPHGAHHRLIGAGHPVSGRLGFAARGTLRPFSLDGHQPHQRRAARTVRPHRHDAAVGRQLVGVDRREVARRRPSPGPMLSHSTASRPSGVVNPITLISIPVAFCQLDRRVLSGRDDSVTGDGPGAWVSRRVRSALALRSLGVSSGIGSGRTTVASARPLAMTLGAESRPRLTRLGTARVGVTSTSPTRCEIVRFSLSFETQTIELWEVYLRCSPQYRL